MPIGRFLSWRRRRRLVTIAAVTVAVVLLVLADRRGLLLYPGDDLQRYDGRAFMVTHVIDGDTIRVDAPDAAQRSTRIRLWGIDTPEIEHRDPPRAAEPYADQAHDMTRRLTEGKTVKLFLETHRLRGTYGRVLAYVELPDGTLLNERLLLAGLARADPRWSHRHMQRFKLMEQSAREAGVGLWSQASEDTPPTP